MFSKALFCHSFGQETLEDVVGFQEAHHLSLSGSQSHSPILQPYLICFQKWGEVLQHVLNLPSSGWLRLADIINNFPKLLRILVVQQGRVMVKSTVWSAGKSRNIERYLKEESMGTSNLQHWKICN